MVGMKVGTKSVLFGAHCFFIHPFFVAWAWWRLYGFPWDPRLWVAFFVHDLGYIGKPNMDGPEGEEHVLLGAKIMHWLFDRSLDGTWEGYYKWRNFTLYHSRFYAKKDGAHFSKLCVADKYSIVLEPAWLYLPRVNWSGEIDEYLKLSRVKYESMRLDTTSQRKWKADMSDYLRKWVEEHKDMRPDTWTPDGRTNKTDSGVWQ